MGDEVAATRPDQEAVLASKLAKLLVELADSTVPVTLIGFPEERPGRSLPVREARARRSAQPSPYERFIDARSDTVARPDLVSDF